MHRCLYVHEILDNIFSFFEGWAKRSTLAKLALTCRVFYEPAIRHLWQHLPGFEPIVKLLPPHLVCFNGKTQLYTLNESFSRVPRKDPFCRIRHYNRVIQRLDWTWDHNLAHHSLFRMLFEDKDCPRPLFPNLQKVQLPYCDVDPLVAVFYPSLVLSSSIRDVEITTNGSAPFYTNSEDHVYEDTSDGWWKAMCGRLFKPAPTWTRFKVKVDPECDGFSLLGKNLALEKLIPRFSSTMSDLDMTAFILDGSGLVALGSGHLAGLLRLSMSVAHQQSAELSTQARSALSFPSLEWLSVNIISYSACCTVLSVLDAKKLETLELIAYMHADYNGAHNGEDYDPQPLFQALLNAGTHTSLERLHLKKEFISSDVGSYWTSHIGEERFVIAEDTLVPLESFSKLKSLTIDPCDGLTLTDHALIRAFGSWPCIEECVFSDETFQGIPPSLTLWGVHQALQHTPSMKSLTLRFDGEIMAPAETLRPIPSHPALQAFDVASSPLSITSSGEELALWLQRHYPKVLEVKSFTWFRDAMRHVYGRGIPSESSSDIRRLTPFIQLTTMVDRWNSVMYVLRNGLSS
ncbi:hypothetical protein BKA70DRAFT_1109938 [Coprinopsis sp. MPI-PUGE-AT-0042]|nr:hypothetical protein BKA70DRAFT_1109938 [Coprinopsis sp. MPI-PUGE-AT-0042]